MNIFQKVTLQCLQRNRSRTIVTIIGILLSTAMMTAITTLVASVLQFSYDVTEYNAGGWHLANNSLTQAEAEALIREEKDLEQGVYAKRLGYAKIRSSVNTPFLYLMDADKEFAELCGMHLVEGRYPENGNEIMISQHMENYVADFDWKIGDRITLAVGQRRSREGTILWQNTPVQQENGAFTETLEDVHTAEFTIVGICTRQPFESWNTEVRMAPGFAAITKGSSLPAAQQVDSFYRLKNPHKYISIDQDGIWHQNFLKANANSCTPNYALLRLSGFASIGILQVIKGLAALVLMIVGGASIALVYNAFAISVSERTKQFGLLSSLGATKKQLRKMVRFEALAVSAVGIPLGILSGLLGIGITLQFVGQAFTEAIYQDGTDVVLHMVLSPMAILIASVCALITVLLSAWMPSRKATRISAVEAIRQNQDIQLSRQDVKSSPFTLKIFGFSGVLGQKYYHRSRKKYRSTILSLFMSILLFITACSFTEYIGYVGKLQFGDTSYDIDFYQSGLAENNISNHEIQDRIHALAAVDDVKAVYQSGIPMRFSDGREEYAQIYYLKDEDWQELLALNHLDTELYTDPDNLLAAVAEAPIYYDSVQNKYIEGSLLETREPWVDVPVPVYDETGALVQKEQRLTIGALLHKVPWYADCYISGVSFFYPEWAAESLGQGDILQFPEYHIKAEDNRQALEQLKALSEALGPENFRLYDHNEERKNNRNLVLITQIFSYGFITLITLIAVANVFNTVSTNISLRRREFAMLKTVGMGRKMFFKMLAYECFLCTGKALLYGLPASLLATISIDRIIGERYVIALRIPWAAMGISVLGVLAVMACTMGYAVQKLKKQNLTDALKNENL